MQILFIASLVGAFVGIALGIFGGIKFTQGFSPAKEEPVKSVPTFSEVSSESTWPPSPSSQSEPSHPEPCTDRADG